MVATSAGGHWVQMRRLLPAFEGMEVIYAGVEATPDPDLGPVSYNCIRNVSRRDPLGFLVIAWQLVRIMWRERPDVVVTTGAAPGLMALAFGKLVVGSRTVWINSIASAKTMTLSGRLARFVADAWLVQWEHLARPGGPEYWGAVLWSDAVTAVTCAKRERKVMAVASGGGHWVELRRLLPAFHGLETIYAGVDVTTDADLKPARYYRIRDVSRRDPLGFAVIFWQLIRIMRRERPDAVVTTGAAPGLMALVVGKLVGCRTVWIDTIASVETMSLSGRLARFVADAWLVQWEHLARPGGPEYWGAVL